MLMPKRTKFRKQFRGKRRGMAQSGNFVAFGEFGLQRVGGGDAAIRANASRCGRKSQTTCVWVAKAQTFPLLATVVCLLLGLPLPAC